MLWLAVNTAQAPPTAIGPLRRRGSCKRRIPSFCQSQYIAWSRIQQHFTFVAPNLLQSDSSPSPSPSPSPAPASAPVQGAQGAGSSRTFPTFSHSSGSGSSSPNLPARAIHVDDEREGIVTTEDGDRTYYLEVVQTPERTAEFGNAVLSRLPLAPALVVQLTVRDRNGEVIQIHGELPFLVAHLALLSENGSQYVDATLGNDQSTTSPSQRLLYGSLVSSPHFLQNLQGHPGIYFIFPDVNVRNCGRYRLKVSLLKIARQVTFFGLAYTRTKLTLSDPIATTSLTKVVVLPWFQPEREFSRWFLKPNTSHLPLQV